MLSSHCISVLDKSLELVVFGKRYDLQNCSKLGEDLGRKKKHKGCETWQWGQIISKINKYLMKDIESNRVEKVLHNDSQDRALTPHACYVSTGHRQTSRLNCIHSLQRCLCSLLDVEQAGHKVTLSFLQE